jgi:hypothetical protein
MERPPDFLGGFFATKPFPHHTHMDTKPVYRKDEYSLVDKFNEAILGVDDATLRVIYSVRGIIKVLVQDGIKEEDAYEHFYWEISSFCTEDKSPIFCDDNFKSS